MTIRILVPATCMLMATSAFGQAQQPVGPMSPAAPTSSPSTANPASNVQTAPPVMPTAAPSAERPTVITDNDPVLPASPEPDGLVRRSAAAPAAPGTVVKIEVPTGTHIPLVLHNAISTRSARPGDPVYFETSFPVMIDGKVVIPAGSYVSGEVTESKRAGKIKGRAELGVRLTTIILPNAYQVSLAAAPSNAGTGGHESTNGEGTIVGDSDKASDAGTVIRSTEAGVGIGAGVGAAAGHIGEGVGIGAGAGAAAGLLAVLLTRGPDAELPRGTTLEAVLDRPVMFDADKVQFTSPGTSTALSGPPDREPQRQKIPF
jgi:hypothetical protein